MTYATGSAAVVLDLFPPDPEWLAAPATPLVRRFAEHHAAHPEVWRAFERYALEALHAGAKRIGAKAIAERVRWDARLRPAGRQFKVNNSFVALYARLLIYRYPQMASLIETRERRA